MSTALIDYNMGNLGSVAKALEFVGASARVVASGQELRGFDCCMLPGVGNFGDGMENLRQRGFDRAIRDFVGSGGFLLGICLGMQMLFEESEEAPGVAGLGVFPGKVLRFPAGREKVPHMGWNSLTPAPDCPLFDGIGEDSFFYFVHSYYVPVDPAWTAATCEYILPFSAAVGSGRWFATQFHPEKSQRLGLRLLRNFLTLGGGFR